MHARTLIIGAGAVGLSAITILNCSVQKELKDATAVNKSKLTSYNLGKDELIKLSTRMENGSINSQTAILDSLEKDKTMKQVFKSFFDFGKKVATASTNNIADTTQQKLVIKEYANKVSTALKVLNR